MTAFWVHNFKLCLFDSAYLYSQSRYFLTLFLLFTSNRDCRRTINIDMARCPSISNPIIPDWCMLNKFDVFFFEAFSISRSVKKNVKNKNSFMPNYQSSSGFFFLKMYSSVLNFLLTIILNLQLGWDDCLKLEIIYFAYFEEFFNITCDYS